MRRIGAATLGAMAAGERDTQSATSGIGAWPARVLVFAAGAIVLVIETLAARLVAPYVGLTLESHTAAIGIALLGIAAGASAGGRLADATSPRAVVGAGFAAAGALVFMIRPIIHGIGPGLPPGASSAVVAVGLSTLAPVVALSVVPPAVVKLRLHDLRESGSVVGSLSAYGTVGALAGTFLTGFVFVARMPTAAILTSAGLLCLALSALSITYRPRRIALLAALAVLGAATGFAGGPCDVETAYYCARVEVDAQNRSGRLLYLDDLPHSYVDLRDPTHLRFWYISRFAGAIDATFEPGRPVDAVHLGGGAFTMPRWLAATRPGSRSVVLELDPTVVSLGRARLGVESIEDLRVVTGDARISLRRRPDDSADVVVGDAFGSRSVPWHLATREFLTDVRRVLRGGGVFVINIIDHDPLSFLRAEAATVAEVFDHVALIARPRSLDAGGGGNYVLVARESRPSAALDTGIPAGEATILEGEPLRRFIAGARVLTDEFSPVDQLLTPYA